MVNTFLVKIDHDCDGVSCVTYDDHYDEIARLKAEVERLLGEEARLVDELTASCARAELQQREAERLRRNNAVLHDTIEKIFEEGAKQLARADTARNDALEEAAVMAETSINKGGMAKSMAFFVDVADYKSYKQGVSDYAAAIRALIR